MALVKLTQIAIAATNVEEMVAFYNEVMDANLTAVPAFGDMVFHTGALAGLNIVLVPNGIAGVNAEQNRQQLRFTVTHVEKMAQKATESGGSLQDDIQVTPEGKMATVVDPDGNTIELFEA